MSKANQSRRHPDHDHGEHGHDGARDQHTDTHHEPGPAHGANASHSAERAREQARQQAMAVREKSTKAQASAAQANVMRLKKGNLPRGGR